MKQHQFKWAVFFLLPLALCQPSYADRPCPTNPCFYVAATEKSCESQADWIVTGIVSYVRHGLEPFGNRGAWVWDRGRVELADAKVTKGKYEVSDGRAVLTGALHCFAASARIPEELKGKRIRVFGMNQGFHGVVGFELENP